MKKPADLLLAMLHARFMKPAGFKKNGNTFSRSYDEYAEHFNIQGSAWNSSGGPWRFYVNCAISFPDIPLKSPDTGLWKYHAHARLGQIMKGTPSEFDVSDDTREQIVGQVGGYLMDCSEYFKTRHHALKQVYQLKGYISSFLATPELQHGEQDGTSNGG
jgi:hypothetical protein